MRKRIGIVVASVAAAGAIVWLVAGGFASPRPATERGACPMGQAAPSGGCCDSADMSNGACPMIETDSPSGGR
jgi:hypothetical protein